MELTLNSLVKAASTTSANSFRSISKKKARKESEAAARKNSVSLDSTEGGRAIKSLLRQVGPSFGKVSELYEGKLIGIANYTPRAMVYTRSTSDDTGDDKWEMRCLFSMDVRETNVDVNWLREQLLDLRNRVDPEGIVIWLGPMYGPRQSDVLLSYVLHPDGTETSGMMFANGMSLCPYDLETIRRTIDHTLKAIRRPHDCASYLAEEQKKYLQKHGRSHVQAFLTERGLGMLDDSAWSELCEAIMIRSGLIEDIRSTVVTFGASALNEAHILANLAINLRDSAAEVYMEKVLEVKREHEDSRRRLTADVVKYKQARDAAHRKAQEIEKENTRLRRELKMVKHGATIKQSSVGETLHTLFSE